MKKFVITVLVAIGFIVSSNAQEKMNKMSPKVVSLEQTAGEFTQKHLTLSAGIYVFEISNNGVGHDVGFVLVEKGKDVSNPDNHIQTAYVTKAVETGKKESSNPTKLSKGEYVYFCPLNPTATDNTIVVN